MSDDAKRHTLSDPDAVIETVEVQAKVRVEQRFDFVRDRIDGYYTARPLIVGDFEGGQIHEAFKIVAPVDVDGLRYIQLADCIVG